MALHKVYRVGNTLIFNQVTGNLTVLDREYDYVGEFEADCSCDYIMHMIEINNQEGKCDKFLSELEERIKREGI